MGDAELRAKLRPVFDKFDADGSGAVSTDEMAAMVKQLKMDITDAKLRRMMVDADPDMSGQIDFDEFVITVKKQIDSGNGGELAKVVDTAGGFFGMFNNLFGMFGGGDSSTAAPAAPAASTGGAAPARSSPPKGGASPPAASAAFATGSAPSSPPAYAAPPPAAGLGASYGGSSNLATCQSLFDQYAAGGADKPSVGHNGTRTTRLRAGGVKLSCYVNTEVDRGRATVISLPEDCDTLAEVMPMIQKMMQLDKRMLYAAELYLPSGEKIITWKVRAPSPPSPSSPPPPQGHAPTATAHMRAASPCGG